MKVGTVQAASDKTPRDTPDRLISSSINRERRKMRLERLESLTRSIEMDTALESKWTSTISDKELLNEERRKRYAL